MSAREELAEMVYRSGYNDPESPRIQPLAERPKWEADSHYRAADDILAAGYSKPRTITTVAELDALPEGAAVLDADRDVSTKHNGMWHGYEMNPLDSRKFAKCGTFTVLYEPTA